MADPTTSIDFTDAQQSAFDIMKNLLDQYNLGSLTTVLQGIIQSGITDASQIQLQLQNTQEWKTRFAGNEMLRQAGLPVLSVDQYLSVEQSYSQIMKNYGLPTGFYDDPSDFAKFIGSSVSPNELQQRAGIYADFVRRSDPAINQQLLSMGMTQGDLIAYAMDPTRAMPLIQQKYQTALVGAAAIRSGVTGVDNSQIQHLTDLGVSEGQAIQGFGQIAGEAPGVQRLGNIYGENITTGDLVNETFAGDGNVAAKKKRLASQERAAFSGSSGVGQGSLGHSSSGSY